MTGFTVTEAHRAAYQAQGFIKLEQVFSRTQVAEFERHVSAAVALAHKPDAAPLPNSDSDAYARAFTQVMNLWEHSPAVRQWVFSLTLARTAAQLMNVAGVRLYHDQALYKEAGGGYTPWHCDQYYWPLDTDNTITAWIPLQDTPAAMGPLAFSAGSHLLDLGRDLPIGPDSEQKIAQALASHALPYAHCEFNAGDVSFHSGWTFHRADANTTDKPRRAMTVIYMADGTRLKAPENPNQQADWDQWCPGASIGEPVATALNPLLYPG
jgi:ectoine hydroxylase-related dioxygenase (phytanoyl-CoA dioxygenase family)